MNGAIAQLARAPALQAGGPGFESLLLHQIWGESGESLNHSTRTYLQKTPRIRGRLAQLVRARH